MPVIRWGVITQADPLRVQLDGDADPMVLTPMTIVGGLRVGDRVLCVEQHRRVIVLGRAKGAPFLSGESEVTSSFPTITFPAGMFTQPPKVVAQLISGAAADIGVSIMVTNVTVSGFQCRHSAGTGTKTVHWHAVQM